MSTIISSNVCLVRGICSLLSLKTSEVNSNKHAFQQPYLSTIYTVMRLSIIKIFIKPPASNLYCLLILNHRVLVFKDFNSDLAQYRNLLNHQIFYIPRQQLFQKFHQFISNHLVFQKATFVAFLAFIINFIFDFFN